MYDRKIVYLHRYEREVDKGTAGYLKMENRDGTCSFQITLMNLPPEYICQTEFIVEPFGFPICKVHVKDGQGQGMAIYEEKQLLCENVPFEKMKQFVMVFSETTSVKGEIIPLKSEKEEVAPVKMEPESQKEIEAAWIPENVEHYESKWDQLKSGRKKVNLLGKESNYIEITPKDMIALSTPYHSLVNNAFLLHGYYNYKHLILGPAKEHKSTYFIGVPGNFYKQEVNAARMFGFEYFENGSDNVQIGDFGYYMKKVRL